MLIVTWSIKVESKRNLAEHLNLKWKVLIPPHFSVINVLQEGYHNTYSISKRRPTPVKQH